MVRPSGTSDSLVGVEGRKNWEPGGPVCTMCQILQIQPCAIMVPSLLTSNQRQLEPLMCDQRRPWLETRRNCLYTWAEKKKLRVYFSSPLALILLGKPYQVVTVSADKSENSFLFICVFSAFPLIDFSCKESYKCCFCGLFLPHCICVISEGLTET